MNPNETKNNRYNSLMWVTKRPSIEFISGNGSWLYDKNGYPYLDFVQGWAVNCLGHCPEPIVRALRQQSDRLISASPAYYTDTLIELADLLVAYSRLDKVFFANTGAEANEGAIKLARKWGSRFSNGAYEIVTTQNSFHGRTLATMSASGKPQWDNLFEPKVKGFSKVVYNDIQAVADTINDNTVAVMVEPIQGEGGVVEGDDQYFRDLRELTNQRNILLILDEVQTGIGRTGTLFGYEQAGIEPDILTLGKGIGGGVPLAAILANQEICCFESGDQGGTYNGNALMTAVGQAVLETVAKPSFLEHVRDMGNYLASELAHIASIHNQGDVRGRGLLRAMVLSDKVGASSVVDSALRNGLIINAPRSNLLRFMPALNVTKDEIDVMITRLNQVFCEI